jgi:hypothetical protein
VVIDEAAQRVFPSNGGNLGVKYYLTKVGRDRYQVERAVDNVWDDIPGLGTTPGEDLGYPTQKTAALLERILTTGSDPATWCSTPSAAPARRPLWPQSWAAAGLPAMPTTARSRRRRGGCTPSCPNRRKGRGARGEGQRHPNPDRQGGMLKASLFTLRQRPQLRQPPRPK